MGEHAIEALDEEDLLKTKTKRINGGKERGRTMARVRSYHEKRLGTIQDSVPLKGN